MTDIEKDFNEALNIEDEWHQSELLEVLAPKLKEEQIITAFNLALEYDYLYEDSNEYNIAYNNLTLIRSLGFEIMKHLNKTEEK